MTRRFKADFYRNAADLARGPDGADHNAEGTLEELAALACGRITVITGEAETAA